MSTLQVSTKASSRITTTSRITAEPPDLSTTWYPPEVIERWRIESDIAKQQIATGEPKPMTASELAAELGIEIDDHYNDEPLPKNWEEELAAAPEFLAECDHRLKRIETDMAAGFYGYATDEVFDKLHRKTPRLYGVKNG